MDEANERIEAALAAYLDFLEMGGAEPDVSHLSTSEQKELKELIRILDLTEGVPLGLGRREDMTDREPSSLSDVSKPVAHLPRPGLGDRLVTQLGEALPPDVRITPDPTAFVAGLGGVEILGGWIVGTFGGRVRVWLLAADDAGELEKNVDCLDDIGRVFGMFPDTVAIALVGADLSCLLVEPEDCAPSIEVPRGSLIGRRYRRPIQPVDEAVSAFLGELVPYWDPIPGFDQDAGLSIDASTIASESARAAIEDQQGIGGRARKTNPKRKALTELGKREVDELAKMAIGLYEGRVEPRDVSLRLRKLAKIR